MSEWGEKPLGELATIRVSNVDKKSLASEYPVRLCNYMDVYSGTYLDDEVEYMEATASAREIANFSLQIGDVVITKDSESPDDIGIPAVVDRTAGGLVCGYHLAMLRPEKSKVDPLFLLKQIETDAVRRFYLKQAAGSTRYALSTGTIEATPIKLAPLEQQRIIARILRTIDTQIEVTEKLITKQERVRAGLMQDLFTRGVDEHGRLRPPREEAPHLYHQTELGWLPLGWEAPELEDLLAPVPTPMRSGPFGSALLKHELVDSGVPLLGIDNIHVEHFKADFTRFVTRRKFSELSRYRVLPDDVVITIMGTVGRCCVIPDGFGEMLSSKHLWTISLDQSKALPKLVCWQLGHATWVDSWFRKKSQGGIMDAIQSSTLKRLRLPMPTLPEQSRMTAIYEETTSHLGRMREEYAKLTLQKSGLMQDLLTGKVSVAPLLESAAA
ncbi:restriction endonuclease subunit S [Sphingomonas sp. ERG5]|uniref:restriction endonuclease subunit S n=1 Tax=Sphingomonas sp. ERG5 TaxID=1381597 RepID=UPI00068F9EA2|nr:restriction endonuclease subunit S [Sphingomonas sp. ERG5]